MMTPVSQPKLGFRQVTTPNAMENAIAVTVLDQDLTPDRELVDTANAAINPALTVTTYATFPFGTGEQMEAFGSYLLTSSESGDGLATFYFAKPKTLLEANTPYKREPRFGPMGWPSILLRVKMLEVPNFPHSSPISDGSGNLGMAIAKRFIARLAYIPGATNGTLFFTEYFLSPSPFQIPQRSTPQPGAVQASYLGVDINFPECLHDHLHFPAIQGATSSVYSTGEAVTGSSFSAQDFPATNHTRWRQHVISEDASFLTESGVYQKIRVRVRPPRPSRVAFSTAA